MVQMVMLYRDPKDETINSSSAVTDSVHQTENVKDSSELSLGINEINKLKSDIAALKVDVKLSCALLHRMIIVTSIPL